MENATSKNFDSTEHDEILALSLSNAISLRQLHMYRESMGTFKGVLHFSPQEIHRAGLLKRKNAYEGAETVIARAKETAALCENLGIEIVCFNDEQYPAILRHIDKPPLVLYVLKRKEAKQRIKLSEIGKKSLAVVGTRRSELPINGITKRISKEVSLAGIHIVSGMALGVDRFAHLGALEADVPTIAVLAGGVDNVYPNGNRDIYKQIFTKGGILLSEHPPGVKPLPYFFPARNRIISGMSSAVFLPQAPEKSGAMITAMHAVEQGKTVYVLGVPNDDSEHFAGNRFLKRAGAVVISDAKQLLDDLNLVKEKLPLNEDEEDEEEFTDKLLEEVEEVLVFLQAFPRSIEEIATITGKSTEAAEAMVMEMRLSGLVKELPGNRFCAV